MGRHEPDQARLVLRLDDEAEGHVHLAAGERRKRSSHRLDAPLHVEQPLDLLLVEHEDGHQQAARIRSASSLSSSSPRSSPWSVSSAASCCSSNGTPGGSGARCQWTWLFPSWLPRL